MYTRKMKISIYIQSIMGNNNVYNGIRNNSAIKSFIVESMVLVKKKRIAIKKNCQCDFIFCV